MRINFYRIAKISVLSVGIFTSAAFNCGGKIGSLSSAMIRLPLRNQIQSEDSKVSRRTKSGLMLESAKPIPKNLDEIADASFSKLVKDSRAQGYTNNLDARAYTIIVKQDCEKTASGDLAFRIRADDYNNTIYDKNPDPRIGEVLAAEQVIMSAQNTPTNSYVICYASPALMTNTVRYGAEHIILFHNNLKRYRATINHATSGIPHPLIPEGK